MIVTLYENGDGWEGGQTHTHTHSCVSYNQTNIDTDIKLNINHLPLVLFWYSKYHHRT